jgi:uncharacterized protein (DUF2147 family)
MYPKFVLCSTALACLFAFAVRASDPGASPVGRWKTVDDKTGKPRSIVRIYEDQGLLFGQVESSLNPQTAGRRCDKCTDERKGQPVVGMVIVRKLKKNGAEFSGGDILDPDTGSIYKCKIRVIDGGNKLQVRGYMGISVLGRSQTWMREP